MSKSIEAGKAFLKLSVEDSAFKKGLDQAVKQVNKFAGGLRSASLAIGAAGTAITAPFIASLKIFADFGSALNDMSARTGASVETLSELKFAAEQSGASIEDVEKALRKMAKEGLDPNTFFEVAKGIAAIEDPSARAAAAMKAWGKSGTLLLPMIADMDALRKKAQELGLVMSTEAAQKADRLGDAFDALKAQLTAISNAIGGAVAPAVTALGESLQRPLALTIEWIKQNPALVTSVGAFGVVLVSVAATLGAASVAMSALVAAVSALASPIGLAVAAIGAFSAGILVAIARSDAFRASMEKLNGVFETYIELQKLLDRLPKARPDTATKTIDDQIAAKEKELREMAGHRQALPRIRAELAALEELKRKQGIAVPKTDRRGDFKGGILGGLAGLIGPMAARLAEDIQSRAGRRERGGLRGFETPPQSFEDIQQTFGPRGTFSGRQASQIFGTGENSVVAQQKQTNSKLDKAVGFMEKVERHTKKLESLGPIRAGIA